MNTYLCLITGILVGGYLINAVVTLLNLDSLTPELPGEFIGVYDQTLYARSQEYARQTSRLSLLHETVNLVLILLFITTGGFNVLDLAARSAHLSEIPTGLLFTGMLALLSTLVNLPFTVYSTFVLEQRFGFNTTTLATFLLDRLKTALLAVLLGGPLLAGILWFFERSGQAAWAFCWIASAAFILVIQFVAPAWIMPLFNTFTPLEDGELKETITTYADSQQFAIQGIYTMDGSKRSTRANAFFTGFG